MVVVVVVMEEIVVVGKRNEIRKIGGRGGEKRRNRMR